MYFLCKFLGRTRGAMWERVRKSARKTPENQGFGHFGAKDVVEKQRKRSMAYASKTN